MNERMKVLIADSFEIPGGEEEVAFYIYENLDREKCDIYITGNEKSGYFKKKAPIDAERIDIFVKGKYNFFEMLRLRKIVKKLKIDIINVHGYSAGFFVRVACAGLKNTKVIWTTHGNVDLMFKDGSAKQIINTSIENCLNRSRFFTDEIITVCKDGTQRLRNRKVYKIPITNIYNGIDTSYFSQANKTYNNDNEALTLGFFSRLSFQKDIPLLLRAMKKLVSEGYNVKLRIAGDGDEKAKMINYINENNLNDNIEYLGFVSNMLPLFESVDVVVLPTHFECLPMILLESMCSGTPVIASDVGGVSEVVVNDFNGFVVPAEDDTTFINAIIFYYKNRDAIRRHGLNGKQYALEKFDKNIMVQSYFEVFKRNWVK